MLLERLVCNLARANRVPDVRFRPADFLWVREPLDKRWHGGGRSYGRCLWSSRPRQPPELGVQRVVEDREHGPGEQGLFILGAIV